MLSVIGNSFSTVPLKKDFVNDMYNSRHEIL